MKTHVYCCDMVKCGQQRGCTRELILQSTWEEYSCYLRWDCVYYIKMRVTKDYSFRVLDFNRSSLLATRALWENHETYNRKV